MSALKIDLSQGHALSINTSVILSALVIFFTGKHLNQNTEKKTKKHTLLTIPMQYFGVILPAIWFSLLTADHFISERMESRLKAPKVNDIYIVNFNVYSQNKSKTNWGILKVTDIDGGSVTITEWNKLYSDEKQAESIVESMKLFSNSIEVSSYSEHGNFINPNILHKSTLLKLYESKGLKAIYGEDIWF